MDTELSVAWRPRSEAETRVWDSSAQVERDRAIATEAARTDEQKAVDAIVIEGYTHLYAASDGFWRPVTMSSFESELLYTKQLAVEHREKQHPTSTPRVTPFETMVVVFSRCSRETEAHQSRIRRRHVGDSSPPTHPVDHRWIEKSRLDTEHHLTSAPLPHKLRLTVDVGAPRTASDADDMSATKSTGVTPVDGEDAEPDTDENEASRAPAPSQRVVATLEDITAPDQEDVVVISSVPGDGAEMEPTAEPEAATMTRGLLAVFSWMAPNACGAWSKASKTITPKAALAHGNALARSGYQTVMWGNGNTANVHVDWIRPLVEGELKTKAVGAPARKRKRKQSNRSATTPPSPL
jgi:hypothetical protein